MINNPKFSSLRCFKKVSNSPYKMWKRVGSVAKPFINSKKELHSTARQTHPVVYKHVGYVDIIRPERTILKNSMVGDKFTFIT